MEELKFTWLINSQNPVQNVHSHMHIERLKTFLKIIPVRGFDGKQLQSNTSIASSWKIAN